MCYEHLYKGATKSLSKARSKQWKAHAMPVSHCPPTTSFCKILNSMCIDCNYCLGTASPCNNLASREHNSNRTFHNVLTKNYELVVSNVPVSKTWVDSIALVISWYVLYEGYTLLAHRQLPHNMAHTHTTRCWPTPLWVCIAEWS